mmetsp:Transcript_88513/g.285877  ORF Transcript_88513/g.285877 Transcript_88513/m.285877 type:complete len:402 (-) Transcript_88513:550-1755(-)
MNLQSWAHHCLRVSRKPHPCSANWVVNRDGTSGNVLAHVGLTLWRVRDALINLFSIQDFGQRSCGRHFAHEFVCLDHLLHVNIGLEIPWIDGWVDRRICRVQLDSASGVRQDEGWQDGDAMRRGPAEVGDGPVRPYLGAEVLRRQLIIVRNERHEVDLQVVSIFLFSEAAPQECQRSDPRKCSHTTAEYILAEEANDVLGALVVKEQGLFAGFARKHRGHKQVVLQVFTDREVGHQLDAVFPDVGSRPHSTQHEQPRSPNGAGTDDDLAPGSDDDFGCAAVLGRLAKAHPCRARALEHQPRCCMVCEHSEVWTLHRSVLKEVCARRVATSCILHGDLTQAGPFLRGSIVVVVDGQPGCNTRFHKSLRNLLRLEVPILHVGNLQRTTLAVKTELPDAAHIVF